MERVTIREASQRLRIPTSMVRDCIRGGELKAVREAQADGRMSWLVELPEEGWMSEATAEEMNREFCPGGGEIWTRLDTFITLSHYRRPHGKKPSHGSCVERKATTYGLPRNCRKNSFASSARCGLLNRDYPRPGRPDGALAAGADIARAWLSLPNFRKNAGRAIARPFWFGAVSGAVGQGARKKSLNST